MRGSVLSVLLGLGACAPWVGGETDGLRTLENAGWMTPDGIVELAFDVEEGETSFAATFSVADEDLVFEDGALSLPSKPGLGVELNEEALRSYTVA